MGGNQERIGRTPSKLVAISLCRYRRLVEPVLRSLVEGSAMVPCRLDRSWVHCQQQRGCPLVFIDSLRVGMQSTVFTNTENIYQKLVPVGRRLQKSERVRLWVSRKRNRSRLLLVFPHN